MQAILAAASVPATVTVSCAWGCPFEGEVDPACGRRRCASALDGADELVLADTIGVATPRRVQRLVERVSILGRRSARTCTTRATPATRRPGPRSKAARPCSTRRSAASAAARSRRTRPATSRPRTSSGSWSATACAPGSTSRRSSRSRAGSRSCSAARSRAASTAPPAGPGNTRPPARRWRGQWKCASSGVTRSSRARGERVASTWVAASGLAGDRVVQPTTAAASASRRGASHASSASRGRRPMTGRRSSTASAGTATRRRRSSRGDARLRLPRALAAAGALRRAARVARHRRRADALGVDHRRLRPNVVVVGCRGPRGAHVGRPRDQRRRGDRRRAPGARALRDDDVRPRHAGAGPLGAAADRRRVRRPLRARLLRDPGRRRARGRSGRDRRLLDALDPADLSLQIGDGPAWIPANDGGGRRRAAWSVIAPATPSG